MNEIQVSSDLVKKLVHFVKNTELPSPKVHLVYSHMGATITDSILQAGINYKNVVFPRVKKLLYEYPLYKTTADFLVLMQVIPLSNLICWKNDIKLERITRLSWFFYNAGIDTERDLSNWLIDDTNVNKLLLLDGIGPKTIDYLKIMAGGQAIAIDRHLLKFLQLADIQIKSYSDARYLFCRSAELLQISQFELDSRIWEFMTQGSNYPS